MTEEEALIRAREAAAKRSESFNCQTEAARYRSGEYDRYPEVIVAKAALLNADQPLPVDRDLADLRELHAALWSRDPGFLSEQIRKGERYDADTKAALPTFRAIIQRRIEGAGK